MPNEPISLPSSRRDVDAFLAQRRLERQAGHSETGRLIIAFDATASRGFTWQLTCELQAEMLAEAGLVGGLKLQIVCFRGNREWEQSEWTSDAEALAAWMRRIECRTGYTQIARVLMRARDEHLKAKVSALVYVGDACEEEPAVLYALARDLGMRAFLFQEGEDSEVEKGLPGDRAPDRWRLLPFRSERGRSAARSAACGRGICSGRPESVGGKRQCRCREAAAAARRLSVTKRHPHFMEDEQFRILAVLRKLRRGPDVRFRGCNRHRAGARNRTKVTRCRRPGRGG